MPNSIDSACREYEELFWSSISTKARIELVEAHIDAVFEEIVAIQMKQKKLCTRLTKLRGQLRNLELNQEYHEIVALNKINCQLKRSATPKTTSEESEKESGSSIHSESNEESDFSENADRVNMIFLSSKTGERVFSDDSST